MQNSEFQENKTRISKITSRSRGKPRSKIEDIYVQSSAITIIPLHLFTKGTKKSSDLSKVLQQVTDGGNNRNPLNCPGVFPAFPFTALFILSMLLCKQPSLISVLTLPAPSGGIRSTLLPHLCLYWRITLSLALGNQAKPAKIDGSKQKLEGKFLFCSGWSTVDYARMYVKMPISAT